VVVAVVVGDRLPHMDTERRDMLAELAARLRAAAVVEWRLSVRMAQETLVGPGGLG
jgi:hypothetical protein